MDEIEAVGAMIHQATLRARRAEEDAKRHGMNQAQRAARDVVNALYDRANGSYTFAAELDAFARDMDGKTLEAARDLRPEVWECVKEILRAEWNYDIQPQADRAARDELDPRNEAVAKLRAAQEAALAEVRAALDECRKADASAMRIARSGLTLGEIPRALGRAESALLRAEVLLGGGK